MIPPCKATTAENRCEMCFWWQQLREVGWKRSYQWQRFHIRELYSWAAQQAISQGTLMRGGAETWTTGRLKGKMAALLWKVPEDVKQRTTIYLKNAASLRPPEVKNETKPDQTGKRLSWLLSLPSPLPSHLLEGGEENDPETNTASSPLLETHSKVRNKSIKKKLKIKK